MNLSDPTDEDIEMLAEHWLFVKAAVRKHCGKELDQSLDDLALLQQVVDDKVFPEEELGCFNCIGVALGRVMATNVEGLDWAVIDDEYGRDLTIRYRDTSLVFNVVTMISGRIEDKEEVDIQFIFDELVRKLDELKDQID